MSEYFAYYLIGSSAGYKSLKENNNKLKGVIPSLLEVDEEGQIIERVNKNDLALLYSYRGELEIIIMVQNKGMNSNISNKLLLRKNRWNYFIGGLRNYLLDNKFKAVNFDLEGVKGEYKDLYTEFIAFCQRNLSAFDISLSLSLPAKTENHGNSSWTTAYDYQALGLLADKIIIMAYDYHWPGGPPGPISPFFWVRDVVDYVIMNISLSKLYIALPFYGYCWEIVENVGRASGLSYPQIKEIIEKKEAKVEWDQDSRTPYIMIENQEIWFENTASIKEKIVLIDKYNIPGVAFWRLGLEAPEIWENL